MERERERETETETERETDREKHFELIYRQAKCELQGYVAVWTVERVQCGCNSNLWGDLFHSGLDCSGQEQFLSINIILSG